MATSKLSVDDRGIRVIGGYRAVVGRKKSDVKINPFAPSIEDKKTCEEIGGDWNDDYDVCVLMDGPDGGWTAPIKGAYVWYSVTDLEDATGEEKFKGKYIADVASCLVADSGFYPTFAGGCSPILEINVGEGEVYDSKNEALEEAKRVMLEVAKDIKEGKADLWGLEYCTPRGSKTTPDDKYAIASDSCGFVARKYKEIMKIKDLDKW